MVRQNRGDCDSTVGVAINIATDGEGLKTEMVDGCMADATIHDAELIGTSEYGLACQP